MSENQSLEVLNKKQENTSVEVRQHNDITSSRHEMSAIQLDIYFMLLSKLSSTHKDDTEYVITIKEIEALTGREWNYTQLREATGSMVGKVFEINLKTGILQVAMLSSAEYVDGQGKVLITIHSKLAPYLIDLKNNYTSFQLYCVLSMTSKYAKWLYILFSRWKDLGSKRYQLDELRYLLNLKDKNSSDPGIYPKWSHFKDRVLVPAIMQINQFTDLTISYDAKPLSGKTVTSILFCIGKTKSIQRIIPFDLPEIDEKANQLVNGMHEIGLIDKVIIKKVLDSPELRKRAFKWLFDYRMDKSKYHAPAGHFIKSLAL